MLRFIEQRDAYSVYEREDGSEAYLAHGFPRVHLTEYDGDWMLERWHERRDGWGPRDTRRQSRFLDWLRRHVTDPDVVDELEFCERCDNPAHVDDGFTVKGGRFACNSCIDDYYSSCAVCDLYCHDDDVTDSLHDESVCGRCLDHNYSYCDECEGYYHHENSDEHEHEPESVPGTCCVSPALDFAIRNDGEGMLKNDEQVTVSLPAGTLDDVGMDRIRWYLREQELWHASYVVGELDRRWQTREGNFTKRLSRTLYKKYGEKILPSVLSQVGTIAHEHSKSVDFTVAVTRDLNMSAEDFYHEGSCWWQSYSDSRCTLKTNGGFGLRSFTPYGSVTGRAWVMPLKSTARGLEPTFNTETPDAFVVFNGYGDLEGYTGARIMSHMAGMTYRKIGFSCGPMYINAGGYLVAPEEIAKDYTDGTLRLVADVHSRLFDTENVTAKESVNA